MASLIGKIAFVTGAGSGIGRATCNILAREGASVVAADIKVSQVKDIVKELPVTNNQNHIHLELNVGEQGSIKSAVDEIIAKFQAPPSIIVNAAGITRDNFLMKMSLQDFDEVIQVNLKGTFMVTQTVSDALVKHNVKNASIVNIASIVGKTGNIGQANYTASKAGVEALTKTSAKELSTFGIRVNCILPGIIHTPMTEIIPDKVRAKFLAQIPLGRLGAPEEVAEVIVFLASDKSSYVNGASIDVTGGL